MIIFLLIIIASLLGHQDWQLWKTYTEPRLKHEKMRFDKVLKDYEDIIAERAAKAAEAIK